MLMEPTSLSVGATFDAGACMLSIRPSIVGSGSPTGICMENSAVRSTRIGTSDVAGASCVVAGVGAWLPPQPASKTSTNARAPTATIAAKLARERVMLVQNIERAEMPILEELQRRPAAGADVAD